MFKLMGDYLVKYPHLTVTVLFGIGILFDTIVIAVFLVDWQK